LSEFSLWCPVSGEISVAGEGLTSQEGKTSRKLLRGGFHRLIEEEKGGGTRNDDFVYSRDGNERGRGGSPFLWGGGGGGGGGGGVATAGWGQ